MLQSEESRQEELMRDVFPNLFYDEDEDQANSTSSSWSNRSDFEHPSLLVRRLRRQTLIDFHRPKDERALSKQVKSMGEYHRTRSLGN